MEQVECSCDDWQVYVREDCVQATICHSAYEQTALSLRLMIAYCKLFYTIIAVGLEERQRSHAQKAGPLI